MRANSERVTGGLLAQGSKLSAPRGWILQGWIKGLVGGSSQRHGSSRALKLRSAEMGTCFLRVQAYVQGRVSGEEEGGLSPPAQIPKVSKSSTSLLRLQAETLPRVPATLFSKGAHHGHSRHWPSRADITCIPLSWPPRGVRGLRQMEDSNYSQITLTSAVAEADL